MDLNQYSLAAAQPGLAVDDIKALRIACPPREEQLIISDFLVSKTSQIDRLITKKRELIERLKEKRTALISRTVTRGLPPEAARAAGFDPDPPLKDSGIEWLGEIPEHWTTPPLYARYSIELGKMLNERRITGSHLVSYLRNVDIQWDHVSFDELPEMDIMPSEYQRYTISQGDLLVCEGGEVGRAAVVGAVPYLVGYQKALHRLRARTLEEYPRFLFYTLYWVANTGVFSAGGVSTIAHLTGEQLRRYRFPRPSYSEQAAIVDYLDCETTNIGFLMDKIHHAIACLQEYRIALITAAVTGKIDVRGMPSAESAPADGASSLTDAETFSTLP
jgi:type I restriction enzyme S subunit